MQRLNKIASDDYDNIECWQIVEAFNKGQVGWCRRQLHGLNIVREGDEQSTSRIDDLQILLLDLPLIMTNKKLYFEAPIPPDYFRWKRVSAYATDKCCDTPRRMKIFQVEEGNIDDILRDVNKRPSFEWAETISTLKNNKVLIYTDEKFSISSSTLVYYRQPRRIEIQGCSNPYTNQISPVDIEAEFKDDIVEVMIDEAAMVLAGDIESMNQKAREEQAVEQNN